MQTQAGTAAAELRGANERLESYKNELDAVRQRSNLIETERDKFKAEVDQVIAKRDEVQRNHLAAVRSVADLDSTRQSTEARIAEVARLLLILGKRITSANSLLSNAQIESEKSQARVDELNSSIDSAAKEIELAEAKVQESRRCLLYTSPSPRDRQKSRMPSSA